MASSSIKKHAGHAILAGLIGAGATAGLAAPATAQPVDLSGFNDIQIDIPELDQLRELAPQIAGHIPAEVVDGLPVEVADGIAALTPPVAAEAVQTAAPAPAPVELQSVGQRIVAAAESKIGSPYVWGATGPDAFDCSGLTSWAHQQVGISVPRTSQAQVSSGRAVSRDQLQPGDIVAFYSGASHVGIYAGNGQVIHSSTEGVPVQRSSIDTMPFYGATRYY